MAHALDRFVTERAREMADWTLSGRLDGRFLAGLNARVNAMAARAGVPAVPLYATLLERAEALAQEGATRAAAN